MSWVEPRHEGHVLKFALHEKGRWTHAGEVAHGDNWFVNWSDFPSVVAIDQSFWVAHWLVKQSGGRTYDYDIAVSYSSDAGLSWSAPKPPHRDGAAAEHGFAAIFPDGEGAGMVWLDGRDYVEAKDRKRHPEKSGNFTLRYTTMDSRGVFGDEKVVDSNTCTCCWPSVATTPTGVVAAWRGRTDGELRDNRVARLSGGLWSAPAALGEEKWEIAGCPVNGPALAARGMKVVAAWFTAEGDHPRVRAAFSTDGGKTFGTPIEVDGATPLGRVGLVWRDDDSAVVSWMSAPSKQTGKAYIVLRVIHPGGAIEKARQVVEVSAGRDTGVPQMLGLAHGVMLAWTDPAPNFGVRTATLDFDALEFMPAMPEGLLTSDHSASQAPICRKPHKVMKKIGD